MVDNLVILLVSEIDNSDILYFIKHGVKGVKKITLVGIGGDSIAFKKDNQFSTFPLPLGFKFSDSDDDKNLSKYGESVLNILKLEHQIFKDEINVFLLTSSSLYFFSESILSQKIGKLACIAKSDYQNHISSFDNINYILCQTFDIKIGIASSAVNQEVYHWFPGCGEEEDFNYDDSDVDLSSNHHDRNIFLCECSDFTNDELLSILYLLEESINKNIIIWLFGKFDYYEFSKQLNSKIKKRIKYLGYLSDHEVFSAMSAAVIYIDSKLFFSNSKFWIYAASKGLSTFLRSPVGVKSQNVHVINGDIDSIINKKMILEWINNSKIIEAPQEISSFKEYFYEYRKKQLYNIINDRDM